MDRFARISSNLIFFFQVLLIFLFLFEDRLSLPIALQVMGRLHPAILHLPIGIIVLAIAFLFFRSQFNEAQLKKILYICILLISLSATFTALFGFFLSIGGDYGVDSLRQHKVSGIILSLISYLILMIYPFVQVKLGRLYIGVISLFICVIVAGHSGAVLTHGENFILEPLVSKFKKPDTLLKSSVYELAVKPVLERKCFSCHNENKAKGKFIMTSIEKFKQGGEHGKAWVEGLPDSSRLIQYLHLPLEHENHMPPDGKVQLSPFEISLLEAWIASGAEFQKSLKEYDQKDTLVYLANKVVNVNNKSITKDYTFDPAPPELIEKLNSPFRSVFPLYQNSPALQVDFFVKEFYEPRALEELDQIKEQLVVLNLSKMPIKDNDLKLISMFKNLEKLNLNFTSIDGNGLIYFKDHTALKSIAIAGTSVTSGELEKVLSNSRLEEVFLWNTKIDTNTVASYKDKYPKIKFIHTLFKDDQVLPLSKPLVVNEGVLKGGEVLQLKHAMPGAIIRYTTDGSLPDSINGTVYNKPIALRETTKVKAIACKEGWHCSNVYEQTFFVEGLQPSNVKLLSAPDKKYPGEGALSLSDGKKGIIDVLKDAAWLGYLQNNFEALFSVEGSKPIHRIVISYADNIGSYVFPPTEVLIYAGNTEQNLKLIASQKVKQPENYTPSAVQALSIEIKPSSFSFYKLVAKPIDKLPEWHSGKGQKGWFFVDEVYFY